MSLGELTRNSFQAGIPAGKWVDLVRLFITSDEGKSLEYPESALSDSVLALYRSYPGDTALRNYLKLAIQDGILSVSVFVATFLQAARSPELHTTATLDMLCRIALDAHYSSGLQPIGSVVSYSESPIVLLGTIQDALALLRIAHSLPFSPSYQLTTSASELVILLLSCVTDISQVSTAQALVHFADASDMLQTIRLTPDVRQVLETFVLSLSLLIGDDAKVAREAQMMHTIQMALGKGDLVGPSSETDIVTCSLLLQNLILSRGNEFGAGDESKPVAILVGTLRWTSWAPHVFYTQLFLSALISASHCALSIAMLWRAFIVGRLPNLLVLFEKAVNSDSTIDADWLQRAALQTALTFVLQRSDLVAPCDHVFSQQSGGPDAMQEDHESPRSFSRDLLQQLLASGLIDHAFAVTIDPLISNDSTPRLQTELQEIGHNLESYLDSKLTPDTSLEDARNLVQRVWKDAGSHATFADIVRKRFVNLTKALEVEALSHLCKILYLYEEALDIVSLHVRMSDLIFYALAFLEEYDCETVGDPQTAVTHLGDVVLFAQSTLSRFHLDARNFAVGNEIRSSDLLRFTDAVHPVEALTGDDSTAFSVWFKALFDSEGIEDTILRSTQPKTLLHIAATLFSHAISASSDRRIDGDVLTNGVSYFLGPLLNWTLVGVIKALLREIQFKGFSTPVHLDILQTLLLSPACPRPVLCLCGPNILRLLAEGRLAGLGENMGFNVTTVQKIALQSLRLPDGDFLSMASKLPWQDQSRQATRNALAMARAGKAPCLDVSRCITVTPPSKFLQLLWTELCAAASMGETETCRRFATFVFTTPRSPTTPPLLPLFLHNVLPSMIASIDHQQQHEQTMNVELLVVIISSVLTAALHLEWALRSVCDEDCYVLGQSSAAMARRLSADLRGRKNSPTGRAIAQRLASSQSFVANFPGSMGELGT